MGPVHFNSSTQLLAVVMKGAAGVLLCDTRSTERGARLAPRARLTAGQLEPPSGVTILPGEQILACGLAAEIVHVDSISEVDGTRRPEGTPQHLVTHGIMRAQPG